MSDRREPFADVPHNPRGHFVLHVYAAVQRILGYLDSLPAASGRALGDRFEFLHRYAALLEAYEPAGLDAEQARAWWSRSIQVWETNASWQMPLVTLARATGMDFDRRLALLMCGLIEEDSRFGTLFAELQAPLGERRPTLELIGHVSCLGNPRTHADDPWARLAPLVEAGWVTPADPSAPRSEWVLRVSPFVWDAVRGGQVEPKLRGVEHKQVGELTDLTALVAPPALIDRLANAAQMLVREDLGMVVLRAAEGADLEEIAGALAKQLGRGLLTAQGAALAEPRTAMLVGQACTLVGAIPALSYELAPGETAAPPRLPGYRGPMMVLLGPEGGLDPRQTTSGATLTIPRPGAALRRRFWQQACRRIAPGELSDIVERFHWSGGLIRRVAEIAEAQAALNGRKAVTLEDVRLASGACSRERLDTLADRIETSGCWDDLVTSDGTGARLAELARRCRHREGLGTRLGSAFGDGPNRGVRALFTGPSGTGKTLASRLLAAELGMDIYRVDLAAVVNKYIGETEKNLHLVLSRAEALDVILLLDEGDSLLGRRSEVRSANDRYANLETNYLLQRLEHYDGIVIVTTNLGESIDPAFERRMDVVVPFLRPQTEERRRILELHLPPDHDIEPGYLDLVAARCVLTGGQLRNAVLHAALLALDQGGAVDRGRLEAGIRNEYRKAGGVVPLAENGSWAPPGDSGTATFGDAIRRAGWSG